MWSLASLFGLSPAQHGKCPTGSRKSRKDSSLGKWATSWGWPSCWLCHYWPGCSPTGSEQRGQSRVLALPKVPETASNESGPGSIQKALSGATGAEPEAGLETRTQHKSNFYSGDRPETGKPRPELKWCSWVMDGGASGGPKGRMLRAIKVYKCPHGPDRERC